MILTKVIVNTTTEASDLVANILMQNGSNGATIVDKSDVINFMHQYPALNYDNNIVACYPEQVLVVGVLAPENSEQGVKQIKQDLQKLLKNSPFNVGELSLRTENVNDEHWVDIWMDYYRPFTVGKLKIYASWQKRGYDIFKVPIVLKPGPAFGTGQHPTTELTLKAMQEINLKGKTVLDIGCGSGILGIAAIKLGASKAYLIDIDDVALDASGENSEINKVQDKVTILNKDLIYSPCTDIVGDVIVMNITSEVDKDYAKNIKNNLTNGGMAVISGILPEYEEATINEYKANGLEIVKRYEKDNWVSYLIKRN